MKKGILLFFVVCIGSCQVVYGQGWAIEGYMNIQSGDCYDAPTMTSAQMSYKNSQGNVIATPVLWPVERTRPDQPLDSYNFVIRGNGNAFPSGTLSFSGSGICKVKQNTADPQTFILVDHYLGDNGTGNLSPTSDCAYFYFDSPYGSHDYETVRVTGTFHARMEIVVTPSPGWCDAVELRSKNTCRSPKWEVSDYVTGPWKAIGQTTVINPAIADFVRVGLNGTGMKYFRLTGVEGTTSEIVPVNIFPAGPSARLGSVAPTCVGGNDWYIEIADIKKDPLVSSVKADVFINGISTPVASVTSSQNTINITREDFITSVDPKATFRVTLSNATPNQGICLSELGTIAIPERLPLTASEVASSRKNPGCYNSTDGEVTIDVKYYNGNYTVFVNGTPREVQATGGRFVLNGLAPRQNYSIVVKDSHCEAPPVSVMLDSPEELKATLTPVKQLNCADSQDGQLQVSVTGGKSPTIEWSTNEVTPVISNLKAGTYSATIHDAGCPDVTSSYTLVAPPALGVTFNNTMPSCEGINDGQITIENITNTRGSLSYAWASSDGKTIGLSASVSRLQAGTYFVTITDKVSATSTCSVTKQTILENPPGVTVKINPVLAFNNFPIRCKGDSNGKLEVSVTDPNNQLTQASKLTWSTGDQGQSIENLSEGTYTVSIPYGNNCRAEDSYVLTAPDALSAVITSTSNYNGLPVSCYGKRDGKLSVTATGGAGNYRYTWNDGSTEPTKNNIGTGTYRVTVTDDNTCTTETTYSTKPVAPVEVSLVSQSNYAGFGVSCYNSSDGFVTTVAKGGTGKYTYAWNNYQEGATIQALSSGEYSVTATDENGCSASLAHTVTKPDALVLAVENFIPVSCNGSNDGNITLSSLGGSGGYEFSVNNGVTWQSSPVFNSLKASQYVAKLRDKNNCQVSVGKTISEPAAISIDFQNITSTLCADLKGSATTVVSGGVKEYSYSWKNHLGKKVNESKDLVGVPGGVYTLTVSDQNNCQASKVLPIVTEDGPLASYVSTATRCYDATDGTALLTITKGQSPVTIQWPDGRQGLQGFNLARGIHYVTLTDGNKCATAKAVEITSPDEIKVDMKYYKTPTCYGSCDGVVTLEASGGAGNFEYEWNRKNTASQSELCSGVYPVIVRDGKACAISKDIFLPQPDPIKIETETKSPTCAGVCDGVVTLTATGGNGNYHFTWPNGQVATTQNSLCNGSYKILLNDGEGCKAETLVTIVAPKSTAIDLGGGIALCEGKEHTLDIGPRWLHQQWGSSIGFVSKDQSIKVNAPATYWVEAMDAQGCIAKDTFLLETATDLLNASFLLSNDGYVGDTIVMVEITRPLPDTIRWTYPHEMIVLEESADVVFGKFNSPGTYTITLAVSSGGCNDTVEKTITILEKEYDDEGSRLGYEAFVKKFELHPNPNDGNFDVTVELLEESPVLFTVWDGSTNRMIKKDSDTGKRVYTIHFDLRPLSSGVYVIRLDHAKGKAFLRFVVQ